MAGRFSGFLSSEIGIGKNQMGLEWKIGICKERETLKLSEEK